jgi:hypothetical protein
MLLSPRGSGRRNLPSVNPRIAPLPVEPVRVCHLSPTYSLLCSNCLAPAQPSQPKSRWEQIRAENARNLATRSSWDELRQNASRPKSDNAGHEQIEISHDPAAERLAEQQKFDAMLEAERWKAAEGSRGSSWGT